MRGKRATAAFCAPFPASQVVAPHKDRSAISHGLTGTRRSSALAAAELYRRARPTPLKQGSLATHTLTPALWLTVRSPVVVRRAVEAPRAGELVALAVEGTPADCVAMALQAGVLELAAPPAAVVSGVNRGTNAGDNAWYSGTLAGAREGALLGVPINIAISTCDERPTERAYAVAADVAAVLLMQALAARVATQSDQAPLLLNVNVPAVEGAQSLKGALVTTQGDEHIRPYWEAQDVLDGGENPTSSSLTEECLADGVVLRMPAAVSSERAFMNRIAEHVPASRPDADIDSNAVASGFVSVCPLKLTQVAAAGGTLLSETAALVSGLGDTLHQEGHPSAEAALA